MRNTDAGVRVGWAVIPARAASIALLWLLTGLFAFAAEAVELPPFGSQEYLILGIVLLLAFAALGFGVYLLRWTLAQDPGTPKMQEVARAIQDGANAYLKRQIIPIAHPKFTICPLLKVPPRFARGTAWGAWVRFPLLAGGTLRRGLSGILVFVNFGCAIGIKQICRTP